MMSQRHNSPAAGIAAGRRSAARRAFTLVELMVVVVIVLLLTMVTIRVVVPNTEARRIREAARMVDSFIHGARARAIETGRPFGVRIVAREDGKALTLEYIQVPEPYAGDTMYSRATVISENRIQIGDFLWEGDVDRPGLVQVGDTICFNHSSRMFQIKNITGSHPWVWEIETIDGGYPGFVPGTTVTYKVLRSPVVAGGELELPEPAAIDLVASDFGSGITAGDAIAFLFSPGGALTSVHGQFGWRRPVGPVYLHIGKVNLSAVESVQDFDSYWVSINHQTGLVVAAESAGPDPGTSPNHLQYSRRLVMERLTLGSR